MTNSVHVKDPSFDSLVRKVACLICFLKPHLDTISRDRLYVQYHDEVLNQCNLALTHLSWNAYRNAEDTYIMLMCAINTDRMTGEDAVTHWQEYERDLRASLQGEGEPCQN